MKKHAAPQESYTLEVTKRLFPRTREQVLERFPERPGFTVVEKPVPFARDLTQYVLARSVDLAAGSQPFSAAYRGFDLNRRGDNLITLPDEGTGFEGYGVGRYGSGEDMVLEIARQGKKEIDYLKRMKPNVWRIVLKEINEALSGGRVTPRALEQLNHMLLNCLSVWRGQIRGNSQAQRFRENTAATVASAPQVDFYYDPVSGLVYNVYYRAQERRALSGIHVQRFSGDPQLLLASEPELLEGWKLMQQLGLLGQMAVRAAETSGYLEGSLSEAIRANAGLR